MNFCLVYVYYGIGVDIPKLLMLYKALMRYYIGEKGMEIEGGFDLSKLKIPMTMKKFM